MGPALLGLLALATAPLAAQGAADTLTFASPATRLLVERAMRRHQAQDSLVADYRATLRYRLTFSIGRRRWARIPPAAVEEQEAAIAWQLPNDLRVDFLGRRSRSRSGDSDLNSTFSSPWFVPRGLGDSVRIFGDDFPERAALHPLAADATAWYRYAASDSLTIALPDGQSVTLRMVEFTPRGPAPALIVGRMWLDLASAEVVRLSFRYVGTDLWTRPDGDTRRDSTRSRRANSIINRILSLSGDLEYARQDGRFWMPYRQVISGRVQIPLVSDLVVPFEAVTTFADYRINTGEPVAFRMPADTTPLSPAARVARRDSLRRERRENDGLPSPERERSWTGRLTGGGRYEIHRPPVDSLRAYTAWGDSLEFDLSAAEAKRLRETLADLERQASRLSGAMTGMQRAGVAYERLADVVRYNRVQGLSVGAGYQVRVPGTAFTRVFGTARYGFSDGRPNLRLALLHDAPAGRLTVSAYRDVRGVDPLIGDGAVLLNTLRGIFVAGDHNDYLLATGGRVSWETSVALGTELTIWGGGESQRGVATRARSAVNDFLGGTGEFLPNGAVTNGHYALAGARLDGGFATRTRWTLASDVQAGEGRATGRIWGRLEHGFPGRVAPTVRASAGTATRPVADQHAFRVGAGGTVRGFPYGYHRGQAFWSVQVAVPTGRRWFHPVLLFDAGQAGMLSGPGRLIRQPVMLGGGVGLRLFGVTQVDRSEALAPRP